MTALRFAAVYATLHAAHQLGDHIAQTDDQAARKTQPGGWGAMSRHVGGYHIVAVVMLLAADRILGLGLRPRYAAAGLGLSAATHALLDRRWPVRWISCHTGSPAFAGL